MSKSINSEPPPELFAPSSYNIRVSVANRIVKKTFFWPEWNDNDFNTEKWEIGTSKTIKESKKEKKASPATSAQGLLPLYDDPDGLIMLPDSLKVAYWKRLSEMFAEDSTEPILAPENEEEFEFIKPNLHLFVSEFMRTLISQIIGLVELNKTRPIITEPIGTVYYPTESSPWQPWHHVYCNCKAGKVVHKPIFSSFGKYAVRLYWMGTWRKIMVDDLIPFDSENRILLPTTENRSEIWPLILFKGLVKLGCIEYLNLAGAEIDSFNAITALTGWLPEQRKILRCFPNDLWNVLHRALPKYKWPEKEKSSETLSQDTADEKSKVPKKDANDFKTSKPPTARQSKPSMKTASGPPHRNQSFDDESNDLVYHSHTTMAVIGQFHNPDINLITDEELKDIDDILKEYKMCTSLSHSVFLNQIRDCTLEPPTKAEEIPLYKQLRRHLWDPNYLNRQKSETERIEAISIQILTPWIDYQKYSKPFSEQKLTVSKTVSADNTTEVKARSGSSSESRETSVSSNIKQIKDETFWIDLKDFCKCFRNVFIFHKGTAYNYYYKAVDTRIAISENTLPKDKKVPKDSASHQGSPFSQVVPLLTDNPSFLLSDFTSPKIVFFCAANINDVYLDIEETTETYEVDSQLKTKMSIFSKPIKMADNRFCSSLQLEEYYFKTLAHSVVVLNMKSVFMKGVSVSLPTGRTVLRVTVASNNGGVLHIFSSAPILYGDEDQILPKLTTESTRFTLAANNMYLLLKECLLSYEKPMTFQMCVQRLKSTMFPQQYYELQPKSETSWIFNSVFYALLEKIADKSFGPELIFCCRCFTLDVTTPHIFKNVKYLDFKIGFRKLSTMSQISPQFKRRSMKSDPKGPYDNGSALSILMQQIQNSEEVMKKIILIQSLVRKLFAQRIVESRKIGTKSNYSVAANMHKALNLLEKNSEENANFFLRTLLQISPNYGSRFSFWQDENHRLNYQEFSGTVPALMPSSWCVIFRDVFCISEEVELVPRFYTEHLNCNISIINNDTLELTPTLFLKPKHFRYVPNNLGYTVVIEAASKDSPLPECKWKLRMLTSPGVQIHYTSRDISGSSLFMKEIVEYYVPNKDNIVARYSINCYVDSLITLQYFGSNNAVPFIVTLYKNDEVVKIIYSRGIISFPAILVKVNETSKKSSEQQFNNGRLNTEAVKLIMEVKVKPDSWLVSADDVYFLISLQLKERAECNVFDSGVGEFDKFSKMSTAPPSLADRSPPKKTKAKAAALHSEMKAEDPMSGAFDYSKPHYTVRIVVDTSVMDYLEFKRDTERLEEIRAMKRAWEDADPGRAVRALETRRNFLRRHVDLPPFGEDSNDFRRAIDVRLLNDIRLERSKKESEFKKIESYPKNSTRMLTGVSSGVSTADILPANVLPVHPITIIPLKPINIKKLYNHSLVRRKKESVAEEQLEKQELKFNKYKENREFYSQRRVMAAEVRKTEKIALMEKAEFYQRNREIQKRNILESREAFRRSTADLTLYDRKPSTKTHS